MVGEKGADMVKQYWYSVLRRKRRDLRWQYHHDWPFKSVNSTGSGPAQHEIEADLEAKKGKQS